MSRRFSSRKPCLGVGEGALYTIFRRMCDLFHGEKGYGFRLARNAHGLQRMQRNGAVQRVGGTLRDEDGLLHRVGMGAQLGGKPDHRPQGGIFGAVLGFQIAHHGHVGVNADA